MLTDTTVVAIRALLLLARSDDGAPRSPRQLAAPLAASPTYLGKILGALVRAGLLSSVRGAHGGVRLRRKPAQITLLDVHVATQGHIAPSYCSPVGSPGACGFHTAMVELQEQFERVLSRWTIEDLTRPPSDKAAGRACRMRIESGDLKIRVPSVR